ncbi:MAG: hypothetical protein QOE47_2896, partial [Pyrinomonadaceae bacterium]|nr:hypothetical protein [Pyrinomonadaceae bacterium]
MCDCLNVSGDSKICYGHDKFVRSVGRGKLTVKRLALIRLILLATLACGGHTACGQKNITFQDVQKLPSPAADYRIAYGDDPSQFGE